MKNLEEYQSCIYSMDVESEKNALNISFNNYSGENRKSGKVINTFNPNSAVHFETSLFFLVYTCVNLSSILFPSGKNSIFL